MKTSRHCKVRSSFVWMFAAGLAVTVAACNRHKDTGAPAPSGAPEERRAAPVAPAPVTPVPPSTAPAPAPSPSLMPVPRPVFRPVARNVAPRSSASANIPAVPAAAPEYATLVATYCVTCHSDRLKTAGLTLQGLGLTDVPEHAQVWEKVMRKLRSGEMPPTTVRSRPDPEVAGSFVKIGRPPWR